MIEGARATREMLRQRRERRNAYRVARYHLFKAHGLCPDCGTEYAEPGYVMCRLCRLYRNEARCGSKSAIRSPYKDGRRSL